MLGCATNLPSKYMVETHGDCLLFQIAEKRGVRIEDMGNVIRVAGIVGRNESGLTPDKAIEIYSSVESVLTLKPTGYEFVREINLISADYVELAEIALMYAGDFQVPYQLDDQTIEILQKWCQDRIAFYEKLKG
jgi:hypothetical protein